MYKFFARSRRLYDILFYFCFAGLSIGMIIAILISQSAITIFVCSLFYLFGLSVCLSAATLMSNKLAEKLYNEILNTFFTDCDPSRFIQVATDLIKNSDIDEYKIQILLDISSACLNLKTKEAAQQVLNDVGKITNTRYGIKCLPYYYNNLFWLSLYDGNISDAERFLCEMESSISNAKIRKNEKPGFLNPYRENLCILNIQKGIFDHAEEILMGMFNNSKTMYRKVLAQFALGELYLRLERNELAKDSLSYVLTHGNKLYLVQEACEILSRI